MTNNDKTEPVGKVTGVGGIFFKSRDPKATKAWYAEKLKLAANDYGSLFEFREGSNPNKKGYLQWSPMDANTDYFSPSEKEFMINFRVENLEALLIELKDSGVEVIGEMQEFEYGKFAHIMDPEGNKIELWEPVDSTFTNLYEGKTTK